ncbi:hypothetical protein [Ferrovibrio sp.]|uniref:hypothetical protein n=1 Tax=Ferrovibrio sp. TaxID=1917215 RepID=UPI0035B492C9
MIRLFLVLVLLLSGIQSALACSRDPSLPELTDEDLFRAASAVFHGRIYKTEEALDAIGPDGKPMPIVVGTFHLKEVFKGRPPEDRMVRGPTPGPGNCGLPLMVGLDYVFFLTEESGPFVLWTNGSRAYFNLDAAEPKQFLEKLRALK